jgi:DNA-binding CsgD family transcriptional regulator
VISLASLALAGLWAGFQITQLAPGGRPNTNTLPVDTITFVGFVWAFAVVARQTYRTWLRARSVSVVIHLVLPLLGTLLLVAAGIVSIAGLLSGRLVVVDFGRVFLVGVGLNFIGFNYLIYWDSIGPRITRLVGAALLLIQTIFTFLGLIYIMQFIRDQVAPLPVAIPGAPYAPLSPAELQIRLQLHEWTVPIFLFQLVMSFLAMGLFIYSGWRMRTLDRFLENMSITPHQRKVMTLLADGLNNQEIARDLLISENTVKFHLRGIYKTLEISDRETLAQWFRDRLADEQTTQ